MSMQLRSLADSALLKVAQYAITSIALPLAIWGGNTILERLIKIEGAINRGTVDTALFDQRVLALERAGTERDVALKLLTERAIDHEYGIRRLEELTGTPRPRK